MSEDFVVVKAHPQMLAFVDQLQTKNSEQLAFYPTVVFEREIENGRVFLGLLNGEPCGYIYAGSGYRGNVKCYQVAIEYDARRSLYGTALVVALEDYANEMTANEITLRCGFDLEANEFWSALGYSCVAVVDGGVRRNRRINIWKKYLQPNMFEGLTVDPESGKKSAVFWTKHKQTGVVNGFVRGRALKDYRAILEESEMDSE